MDIILKSAEILKEKRLKVIFTECEDERILHAVRILCDRNTCIPILLGDPGAIQKAASNANVSLEGITVFDMLDADKKTAYASEYHNTVPMYSTKVILRKMNHPLNYAAMLVKLGVADSLASGVINSTGDVILAAQQFIGLKEGISSVSSIGFQIAPMFDGSAGVQIIGVSDCAVCTKTDASQLADIAIISADNYSRVMGVEARVAMLSYSTAGSTNGESVEMVLAATKLAKEKRPDLVIDGEFQIDSALVPEIAARKVNRRSPVAGKANVLIFPNLDAGNIAVKCMQMFGKVGSYGPLLQGFSKPVTDFSRAATVNDVVGNVTLCLLQGCDFNDERV